VNRLQEIARRKQALIERAAFERSELSRTCDRLRSPFSLSRALWGVGHALKTHPIATAGLSTLVAGGYARRMVKSATGMLAFWRTVRPLWTWWSKRRQG